MCKPMTALHTFTTTLLFALLIASPALAGSPLATDDTGTVDIGKVELELNGAYTHDKETFYGITTKCSRADAEMKITTGLYKNLGISLAIPYNINDRVREDGQPVSSVNGFGDMTLEIKYAFAEIAGVSFAIKPAIIMPSRVYSDSPSEGGWQLDTTLIATKEFAGGAYALHANLGYGRHTYRDVEVKNSTHSELWSGSIGGEMKAAKGLFAVAEAGLATTADKKTAEPSACALVGVRYEINDFMDIHAGVKLGLTKPEDDFSLLYGLVLKF